LGGEVADARHVTGGYTGAGRWVVTLGNGRTSFAKLGLNDHTRETVRAEARFYQNFQADFTPQLVAFSDHPEHPLLVLEDLSQAVWPPPWDETRIERVLETLERVGPARPPAYLPTLEEYRETLSGWEPVAADPRPFLGLGITGQAWLKDSLPLLIEASARAVLEGPALVHYDVRSDNIAFLPERTVLIDWTNPAVGNPLLDVVGWLPSLHLEGGPRPEEILGDQGAHLVALVAGYWASRAGLPPPEGAPRVREVQAAQLEVALPWAARLLDLPLPNGR
jgi:hypothetical protein